MRKLIILAVLQLLGLMVYSQGFTVKLNKRDAENRKQGEWSEEVPETRGEEGYTWEGTYVDDKKEGVWKKYAQAGGIIAEENFKHGVLNGPARYFYNNGLVSAEGNYVATDLDTTYENYRVIDPVTGEERFEQIKRSANYVRDGVWKTYDENGNMSKEYYQRGQQVTPEQYDSITNAAVKKVPVAPATPASPPKSGKKKQ